MLQNIFKDASTNFRRCFTDLQTVRLVSHREDDLKTQICCSSKRVFGVVVESSRFLPFSISVGVSSKQDNPNPYVWLV